MLSQCEQTQNLLYVVWHWDTAEVSFGKRTSSFSSQMFLNKQLQLVTAAWWERVWLYDNEGGCILKNCCSSALPLSNPVSRTTTTAPKAATPACCVTATRSALSPERATERAASVSVNPASSDASATAATTPSLRFLLTAVKVRRLLSIYCNT